MTGLRDDPLVPHPDRLPPDHPWRVRILAAHDHAMAAGAARYPDPLTGYWVFTAAYLAARGTCCQTGCRHCPYIGAGTPPSPP